MDSATTNDSPEIKLHFLDYWRIIRLRRSLILMVFFLCLVTSTLLTIWLPKQYSSTVQIEVQKDDPEVTFSDAHSSTFSVDPYFLTTQFKIIESYRILTNVIANLHLDETLAQQNGSARWTVDDTFDYLKNRISVEQTRMTSLIEISVRNTDPQLAARIANAVADSYREFRLDSWKQTKYRGIKALEEKLSSETNELHQAQNELDSLRTNLDIPDIYDQSVISQDILSHRLEDWDHERVAAEADFMEYSNILYHLTNLPTDKLGGSLATAYPRQLDPELNDLAERLQVAKARMVDASNNYGPDMAAFQTTKKQLEDAALAYTNKIEAMMTGIRTRVSEDEGHLRSIQQKEDEITTDKNKEAQRDRPYYNAKAAVEIKRQNATELGRLVIREMAEAGQPNDGVVIVCNPARAEKKPVSPKSILIIPLGIIIGLVVGLGLAFFIEYLDTSVKTIDDVERALQAPVLGSHSAERRHHSGRRRRKARTPKPTAFCAPTFCSRARMRAWNTVSVLSGGAGEGKSTTLFNLATVFAQNGQRVLVVDSDLRRPTVAQNPALCPTRSGLTDFLLKQRSMDEVIQKTKSADARISLPAASCPAVP